MTRKAVLLVGILMFVSGFLFGTQQRDAPETSAGTYVEMSRQAPLDPDRPRGVDPSAWMPLGQKCGVIVRQNTGGGGDFFEGRLTCKFGENWYPVFLSAPPPTITPTK